jgi:hypothetical protein
MGEPKQAPERSEVPPPPDSRPRLCPPTRFASRAHAGILESLIRGDLESRAPGTVVTTSAAKLMDILETQYGGTLTYTRAWALEREPWIT